MNYDLPVSLEVGGIEHPIRSDYRAALDICAALSDPELTNQEKVIATLVTLYEDPERIEDIEDALRSAMWFLSCGEDVTPVGQKPKLMDWEQDFSLIVAPINRLAGFEIRSVPYLHWWTFISYYYEIGECTFSHVVNIRSKKANGKKLEKHERDFYRENRTLIDLRTNRLTENEKNFIDNLLKGV